MKKNIISAEKRIKNKSYDFLINNIPELLPLVSEFKKIIELTVLKTTGHFADPKLYPLPKDKNSLENLLYKRLKRLDCKQRETAIKIFHSKQKNPKDDLYKSFKASGLLEHLHNDETVFYPSKMFNNKNLSIQKNPTVTFFNTMGNNQGANYNFYPLYDKMALRIHQVTCIDETDIESNSDEISLSSIITQAEYVRKEFPGGRVDVTPSSIIFRKPSIKLGEGIGDGRKLLPAQEPWYYHIYDIWNPSGYNGMPNKYLACTFFLSEIDNGGFDEFIEDALKIITKEVTEVLADYAARRIASNISKGIFEETIGTVLGSVIGAIATLLLFQFIDLLIEWWEDDVFPPKTAEIIVPSFDPFMELKGIYTNLRHFDFDGMGGKYMLEYSWHLLPSQPQYDPTMTGPGYSQTTEALVRGATIFPNVFYDGEGKFLKPGSYSLKSKYFSTPISGSNGNNLLSSGKFDKAVDSIKIDDGYAVFAYKTPDYTGTALKLFSDTPVLNDDWRDNISSLIVFQLGGLF